MALSNQGPCDSAVIQAAPSVSACPASAAKWVLAATILGSSMVFIASGINNAASRVAALLAIALLGIVLAQVFNRGLDQRLRHASLSATTLQSVYQQRDKLAAIELPANVDPGERAIVRQAVASSFVAGFRWVMLVSALLALASAASAGLLISDNKAGRSSKSAVV